MAKGQNVLTKSWRTVRLGAFPLVRHFDETGVYRCTIRVISTVKSVWIWLFSSHKTFKFKTGPNLKVEHFWTLGDGCFNSVYMTAFQGASHLN